MKEIADNSQKMIELLPTFITYVADNGNFIIKIIKNTKYFSTIFLFREIDQDRNLNFRRS